MRIVHTHFALTLAVLVALAVSASASAQVQVYSEVSDEQCSDVTLTGHVVSGGCIVHITSEQETQIVAGTAGGPVVVSTCEEEFEAHIDGSGEGYIDVVNISDHAGPACTRTACDESAPSHATIPWRIHIRENPDVLNMSFCLRNEVSSEGTAGTPCVRSIPYTTDASGHHMEFNAEAGSGCTNLPAGAVTWFGHWHLEEDPIAHDDIYVVH